MIDKEQQGVGALQSLPAAHASGHDTSGPSAKALQPQGRAAVARIMSEPDQEPVQSHQPTLNQALRVLHRQLHDVADAEYAGMLQLEGQAYTDAATHLISRLGAGVRDHLPRVLGGGTPKQREPEPSSDETHRSWQKLFTLLSNLELTIAQHRDMEATALLLRASNELKALHEQTIQTMNRRDYGGHGAIAGLELIIGTCTVVLSAVTGSLVAPQGASILLRAASSALAAGVSTGVMRAAEVGAERTEGMNDHDWMDALIDGSESAVTTLVFAFIGGKFAERFVPKLTELIKVHAPDSFFAKLGQLFRIGAGDARDYFSKKGAVILNDLVQSFGASTLATPIRYVFERYARGHKMTLAQFIEAVVEQATAGGAFQALLASLVHGAAMGDSSGTGASRADLAIEDPGAPR